LHKPDRNIEDASLEKAAGVAGHHPEGLAIASSCPRS